MLSSWEGRRGGGGGMLGKRIWERSRGLAGGEEVGVNRRGSLGGGWGAQGEGW